jgi:spore maturation protein CgeB
MNVALFCHSILSDWNHGNAHFLRGVCSELRSRGHDVTCYEPLGSWSLAHLLEQEGQHRFRDLVQDLLGHYPLLVPRRYDLRRLDLDAMLGDVDLALVHEWSDPELVRRIGEHRKREGGYKLLFHDTHHRSVTDPAALERLDLESYDGVLAFGEPVRDVYSRRGWGRRVWTWHEAADVRVFRPLPEELRGHVVWIGNWGDGERSQEIHDFLLEPVAALGLRASVHGVRYPPEALDAVERSGARYLGWIANYRVPVALARSLATVHIPRRPYLEELRGVPTIRPFEALACGVPLVCARWDDPDGLFRAGEDFLVARDASEMKRHLQALCEDAELRSSLAANGRRTILERHTCAHRVDELLGICNEIDDLDAVVGAQRPAPATAHPVGEVRRRSPEARSPA